jgi:hypothetical protein
LTANKRSFLEDRGAAVESSLIVVKNSFKNPAVQQRALLR